MRLLGAQVATVATLGQVASVSQATPAACTLEENQKNGEATGKVTNKVLYHWGRGGDQAVTVNTLADASTTLAITAQPRP